MPQIEQPLVRNAAKLAAAYSHALRPRLLVLVGLASITGALNQLPDPQLHVDLLHQVRSRELRLS